MSPSYQRMLFVCLNDRGPDHPRGSCSAQGGDAVLDQLREKLHARGLKGAVRAVGTRCLGQCAHGPVVTVQSDDVWYGGVQGTDVDELIESHVVGGVPVTRLQIAPEDLSGVAADECSLEPLKEPPQG